MSKSSYIHVRATESTAALLKTLTEKTKETNPDASQADIVEQALKMYEKSLFQKQFLNALYGKQERNCKTINELIQMCDDMITALRSM